MVILPDRSRLQGTGTNRLVPWLNIILSINKMEDRFALFRGRWLIDGRVAQQFF